MNNWIKFTIICMAWLFASCNGEAVIENEAAPPENRYAGLSPFFDAVKKYPDSIPLYELLVDTLANRKLWADAAKWCDSAMVHEPVFATGWLLAKGDLYRMAKNYDSAISAYRTYLTIFPDDEQILLNLANTYAENADPNAISLSNQIAAMFPSAETRSSSCFIKGIYFSNIQAYPESRKFFDSAISLRYNFIEAWMERGYSFYDEKKYKEAADNFFQLTNLNKGNADAWYWLAKSEEAGGNKEEAANHYARAYSLDRNLTDARRALERLRK